MAGLMDIMNDVGRGLAYNTPESKQGREDERELEMWRKKQELSNKLAMDLEQRKRTLAESYPEVKQLLSTPYGVVFSRSTDGTVKEEYRDDEVRDAYIQNKKATMTNAETRQAESPSKIGVNDARAGLMGAQAGVVADDSQSKRITAEAAAARAASSGTGKPPTALQQITLTNKARQAAILKVPGTTTRAKERAFNKLTTDEQSALIDAELSAVQGAAPDASAAPASSYGSFGQFIKKN